MNHLHKCAVASAVSLLWVAGATQAFDIDIGNSNSVANVTVDMRYNIGVRAEKMNPAIGNSTLYDESEYRFPDRGDIVTNRIDMTPQLTLGYMPTDSFVQSFGIRSSGYAFHDFAYDPDKEPCRPGSAPAGVPASVTGGNPIDLSQLDALRVSYCDPRVLAYSQGKPNADAKKQHYQGVELLDLFAYLNFEAFEFPVSLKAGRHSMLWGESLLNPTLGVAYSMGPVDVNKALSVPGASVQDVFLPVNQISGTVTLTDTTALGFQYFLDWEGLRAPEGGSYLGPNDAALHAPDQLYVANIPVLGPLDFPQRRVIHGDNNGRFGLQLKWNPEFMDGGTLGLYYRKFDEINPWLTLAPANAQQNQNYLGALATLQQILLAQGLPVPLPGALGAPLPGGYQYAYAEGTELYGISASNKLFGVSFGTDLAYSHNRALNSQIFHVTEDGQGARGDTLSGVLSGIYLGPALNLFGATLWDSSMLIAELNGSRLLEVTSHPELYKKTDSPACRADISAFGGPRDAKGGTIDGCSSDYALGGSLVFTPTWYQVFPGIDLSMGLAYSTGLKNNSPIVSGGNYRLSIGSATLTANFYSKVTAALSYRYYDSIFRTGTNFDDEPVMTSYNGTGAALADRDWVSLTLKYSF